MLYRRLIINGREYPLAVNQWGTGAPGEKTPGAPGVLYMDTDDGTLYKCIGADGVTCSWEELTVGTDKKRSNFQTIAQGGYSVSAPQNSIQAIIHAAENGFRWVALDIKKCADGIYILARNTAATLYHEGTAVGVTFADAKYSDICEYTWDAAGEHRLCTLSAAFAAIRQYGIDIVLDGKSAKNSELMHLAGLAGMTEHVMLSYTSPDYVLADKALLDRYPHTPVRLIPMNYEDTQEVLQSICNPVYADINAAWSDFTSKYLNIAFSCHMPILFSGCRADNTAVWAPIAAGAMSDDSAYNLSSDEIVAMTAEDYDCPALISAPETVELAEVGDRATFTASSSVDGLAGCVFAYSDNPSIVAVEQNTFGQSVSVTATRIAGGDASIHLFTASGTAAAVSAGQTQGGAMGEVEDIWYLTAEVSDGTLWAAEDKNRLTAARKYGETAFTPDAVTPVYGSWYPIPVPAAATAVTIVCPGLIPGMAFLNVVDGNLKNSIDPGWQAEDGCTYSFEAGTYSFMAVNYKNASNTAFADAYDVSQLSVSFA